MGLLDLHTERLLWRFPTDNIANVTLAAHAGRVMYYNGKAVVALDITNGSELWRSPTAAKAGRSSSSADASLVLQEDVVVFATGSQARGLAAKTGKVLWTKKGRYRGSTTCPIT